ncbi:MAG: hypothetical protein JWL76_1971 [Thermoleophilia bacterium]|nr:hypothetical protein [Thermoleophilia bacterium]
MTELDDRIRSAYGPASTDDDVRERIWAAAVAPAKRVRSRSKWRAPRTLFAVAVAMVSVGSIAVAQPGPIDNMIGGKNHADRLSVLKETDPVGADGLSDMAQSMFNLRHSQAVEGGFSSVDPAQLHKVLDYDAGRYSFTMLSGASADGQACLYTETRDDRRKKSRFAGGGCSLSFEYNGHVTVMTQRDIQLGTLVTGLADDDVKRIRVKLSTGTATEALMGNNGYLLHLKDPEVRTRGLLVDLKDGRTLDIGMNGCLRSQLASHPKSRLGCGFGMNKGPADEVR